MRPNLQDYKQVQTIAKTVLEEIKSFIGADKTEKDIAMECAALLKKHGITKTWYYACPALSCLEAAAVFRFPEKFMSLRTKKLEAKILSQSTCRPCQTKSGETAQGVLSLKAEK